MRRRIGFACIIGVVVCMFLRCDRATATVASAWCSTPIAFEGQRTEWKVQHTPVIGGNVSFRVMNDSQFLYVNVCVKERKTIKEILLRGLNVWFTPGTKKSRLFGIHFPLENKKEKPVSQSPRLEPGIPSEALVTANEAMELLQDGSEPRYLTTMQSKAIGIEATIGLSDTALHYMMKVPLHVNDSYPYGIGITSDTLATILFENPPIDYKLLRSESGGSPRNSGYPGLVDPNDGTVPEDEVAPLRGVGGGHNTAGLVPAANLSVKVAVRLAAPGK
jgi:hypothetical protein